MADTDPNIKAAQIELLKEKLRLQQEITQQELINAKFATDALKVAKLTYEQKEKSIKLLEQEKALKGTSDARQAAIENEINLIKSRAAAFEAGEARYIAALKQTDEFRNKVEAGYKAYYDSATKRSMEASTRIQEQNKINLDSVSGLAKSMARSTAASFQAAGDQITGLMDNQKAGIFAIMSAMGMANDAAITSLGTDVAGISSQIDKSFRGIVRSTGLFSQEMQDAFVYALDPLYANRREKLFETSLEQPLINVGITADDVGKSLGGLLENVSMFRPAFISANKATAVYTANLVSGLAKIGISSEKSMSIIEEMTKSLQKTPMEANKEVRRLVTIADTLGVSAAKVASDFAQALPSLAMFGEEATDQFANLQVQATATGLSMNELVSYAEGLDTFKGAATAAQGLNAVLGGTFVSVTDLVHAPFDEKLVLIREAMERANISFEEAPRRMQQVISKAAGFQSVSQAMKALGNKDEFEDLADGMSTHAASTEEMSEKIMASMNNAEMLRRSLSSLGGGFSKFTDQTRGAAVEAANVLLSSFQGVVDKTRDSQLGVIGVTTALKTLANVATGKGGVFEKIKNLLLIGGGGALFNELGGGEFVDKLFGPGTPDTPAPAAGTPITSNTKGEVGALIASVREFTDTVKQAGKVPINIDASKSVAGTLDVFKHNFEASFKDVTTVATG